MSTDQKSLVERLYAAKSPRDLVEWEKADGFYLAACHVSRADVPELIKLAGSWNETYLPNAPPGPVTIDEADLLLPVTAWRALADLRAEEAVEPLIAVLCESEDEYDDWLAEDLPHVFAKIGPAAIEPLIRLASDHAQHEPPRSVAARALRAIADLHPETRDRIVPTLTRLMVEARDDDIEFNTILLVELVELRAVGAAEAIERAFAANRIDVGMMGGWEEVRGELGVQGLGLEMPANPHDSRREFLRGAGAGVFSPRPIFGDGRLDEDAAQEYYERVGELFSESSEAQLAMDRYGHADWHQSLLQFGIDYRGETVDTMTVDSVSDFLFDFVPRKISTDADSAAAIVFELEMFWTFLDRVYKLPEAKAIIAWLQDDGLAEELEQELSDPSNFGMAKSMVMSGQAAGFDMTTQAGVAQFMEAYNESLGLREPTEAEASWPATPTLEKARRVGRNEPCPCGSGKKFKKCCGRSA